MNEWQQTATTCRSNDSYHVQLWYHFPIQRVVSHECFPDQLTWQRKTSHSDTSQLLIPNRLSICVQWWAEVMPQFRVWRRHDKLWHLSVQVSLDFWLITVLLQGHADTSVWSLSITIRYFYLLYNTIRDLEQEKTSHFSLSWCGLKTAHSNISVTMPQFASCHTFTFRIEAIGPPLVVPLYVTLLAAVVVCKIFWV